jgi:branched-chain amino acid aminotransferase
MNLYFVYADGTLVTPELTGTILEGVTRDSLLTLARSQGLKVVERKVSIEEWRDSAASGELREVFACGTAAVITPVGRLLDGDEELSTGDEAGEVTMALRDALLDIQYGRTADEHGWMRRIG